MLGAPVGGALYKAFGFRGPFIFGSGLALVDIVGRLLVIERKDALPWLPPHEAGETVAGGTAPTNEAEKGEHAVGPSSAGQDGVAAKVPRLSFLAVCKKMVTSPRAITFAFGVCAIQ
jgi:MFS family permease